MIINSQKSICFISSQGWLLFAKSDQCKIGGAEVQEFILATTLAKRGWRVKILCEKVLDIKFRCFPGIEILPYIYISPIANAPFQVLVTCFTLLKGIQRSRCSIIYQRNPNRYSGFIALFCRLLGKKLVVAGAHDSAFKKSSSQNRVPLSHQLSFRLGMSMADTVIAQNSRQKALIRKNYRRDSIVFYNTFPRVAFAKDRQYVLWVAGLMEWKRPELFIRLARDNQDFQFLMVGSPRNIPNYLEKLSVLANGLDNLKIYGHQPFDKADAMFSKARLFVNTSKAEGFPNTFLQAWRRGVPVLSFVDPDNLIFSRNLGAVASDYNEMNRMLRCILTNPEYDKMSDSIYHTFNSELSEINKIKSFETIISR